MDEACSRVRLQIDSVPEQLDLLRSRTEQLEIERQSIEDTQRNKRVITKIDVQLQKLRKECKSIEKIWNSHKISSNALRDLEKRREEFQRLFENAIG